MKSGLRNALLALALCASTLTLNSCSSMGDWQASSIVSSTGVQLLTAGAAEATVYNYVKKNPESCDSFLDARDRLLMDVEDGVLSPEELKASLKEYLASVESKYRTYVLLALDVVIDGYAAKTDSKGLDLAEYKAMLQAIARGIGDAVELYRSTAS